MTEELQTRTEHSRSLEDAERYRALHTLRELGLLIPLDEIETFHGRVTPVDQKGQWEVDPAFTNADNDTGNFNVNKRSSLYAAERGVATDFAKARAGAIILPRYYQVFEHRVRSYTPQQKAEWLQRLNALKKARWDSLTPEKQKMYPNGLVPVRPEDLENKVNINHEVSRLEPEQTDEEKQQVWQSVSSQYEAEVMEIASDETDATVIDLHFDVNALSEEGQRRYYQALDDLTIGITSGSPLKFQDRHKIRPFIEAVNDLEKHVVAAEEVEQIAKAAGIDEATALHLASGYNAFRIAKNEPAYLVKRLLVQPLDIFEADLPVGDEVKRLPVNLEYAARYMREAHIVGAAETVNSGTLAKEIRIVSLFDMEKIGTLDQLDKKRQATWKKLGAIAGKLGEFERTKSKHPLVKLLLDPYAKPEALVDAAKHVDGFEAVFEADAGNWEGFTLAQHTETVLRNFNENFADLVPVQYIGPMRLAILAHDLGKPHARANDLKGQETKFNIAKATEFFDKVGISDSLKYLLLAVIGEGEELAARIWLGKQGQPAQRAMSDLAKKTLSELYNQDDIDESRIISFSEMCRMLLICDGGAYTSMAVTLDPAGGTYRNYPSFNDSFAQPIGPGRRGLKYRQRHDQPASDDLTPQRESLSSEI